MLHSNLSQVVSHMATAGRDVVTYFHAASRALIVMLYRLEAPGPAFRATLRQHSLGRARKLREPRRAVRRKKPFLIHYHIFKNAGTSFEWALQQAFGSGFQLLDQPFHDGFVSRRDITRCALKNAKIRAISSHHAAPPPPRIVQRDVLTSILIRDPIARIRSIYCFERLQPERNPGSDQAKALDFRRYVEWRLETTPRMFCNFQVYFCCRDRQADTRIPDTTDLKNAICALDKIDIVGTVERYAEWLVLAHSVLREYFDGISLPMTRQNVLTGERCSSRETIYRDLAVDLGTATVQYLVDHNELDMCLHQVADSLLSRRLAERRAVVSLRHSYMDISALDEKMMRRPDGQFDKDLPLSTSD